MKILVGCPSYKRSRWLGRAIHCFAQQTHADSEMVIIEDSGEVPSQDGDRWKLIGTEARYPNLGAKRNAIVEAASPDVDGYLCWDDDDVYFPQAVAAVSKALETHPWAQCRFVYETYAHGRLMVVPTSPEPKFWGYGGCWAYRLREFHEVGGYNNAYGTDDIALARKFYDRYGPSGDSSNGGPWYWYNREGWKICHEGLGFWEKRAAYRPEKEHLEIGWNGENIYQWPILPGIHRRPF